MPPTSQGLSYATLELKPKTGSVNVVVVPAVRLICAVLPMGTMDTLGVSVQSSWIMGVMAVTG